MNVLVSKIVCLFSSFLLPLHFSGSTQTGLCTQLSVPCPRSDMPPPFFKDFEINRNALVMVTKLGLCYNFIKIQYYT
jgi:hypothetical protein